MTAIEIGATMTEAMTAEVEVKRGERFLCHRFKAKKVV